MNYKINHIPISKDKRPGTKMTPTSITIHSTANPKSTALNERNWLVNPSNDRTASWHIAVDDKEIIEAIPLNEIAYHAGKREGNNTSIGIEICESGDRAKTIQNTIELVAKMLYERKWGVDKLKRHFDWSGKICPGILSKNNWEGWNAFKIQVERELNKWANGEKSKIQNEPEPWAVDALKWGVENKLTDGSNVKENISLERFITILHRYDLQNK